MKALMVGDNRDTLNWGGRGQSIALYRLLKKNFDEVKVIYGESVTSINANDGYINTLLPLKLANFFIRIRSKSRIIDSYMKFENKLGARDFISDDPEESASMIIHHKSKRPGLSRIYELVNNSDVVIINGEGSGIFSTPYRRDFFFYLMIAELAVQLKKDTFYVNGIISDCPISGRNIKCVNAARKTFEKCNAISVRDPESFEYVKKEMPKVMCTYIPDALFTWYSSIQSADSNLPTNGDFILPFPDKEEYFNKLDFSKPYICVGGSSLAAYQQSEALSSYTNLVNKLRELGLPIYLTECCTGDRFLQEVAAKLNIGLIPVATPIYTCAAVLANARIFVSGRFHPTIMASLGGTPSIFLGAHSHKMRSLQNTLEYQIKREFSALPIENEFNEILSLGEGYLSRGDSLRSDIMGAAERLDHEAAQMSPFIVNNL